MSESPKGYLVTVAEDSDFYVPGALHIERDDDLFLFPDDEAAAHAAELDGVKLIYGMEDIPDGVYLDTAENRKTLLESLGKYPEYKNTVGAHVPEGPTMKM